MRGYFGREHRAFWLIVANGVLFQLSLALFDPRRVIAAFLTELSDKAWLVGLAMAIQPTAMTLPQLYASHLVSDGRQRMPYYVLGAHIRWIGSWLVVAAVIALFKLPTVLAVVFLALIGVVGFGTGIGVVAFGDIVTRTVPRHRRGRLFGLRIAVGGLLAFALGGLIQRVLSPGFPLAFPLNYALLFGLSAVLLMFAQLSFMRVQEPPTKPSPRPAETFLGYLAHTVTVIRRDRNAVRYLIYRNLAPAGWVPVAFAVPYAMKQLHFSAAVVGWFVVSGVIAGAVSNVLWAQLSDRVGNRVVIRLGMALVVTGVGLMALTPLVAAAWPARGLISPVLIWLLTVTALSEMGQTGVNLGGLNYIYELGKGPEVPLYIGAMNSFAAPALALTPPLMGLIAERWGYDPVHVIGAIFAALALLATLGLREPRRAEGAE